MPTLLGRLMMTYSDLVEIGLLVWEIFDYSVYSKPFYPRSYAP
jgi:hypothetical protein